MTIVPKSLPTTLIEVAEGQNKEVSLAVRLGEDADTSQREN